MAATGDATKLTFFEFSVGRVGLSCYWDKDELAKCQGGTGITWDHYLSGHLHSSSGSCLTQSKNDASIEECVIKSVEIEWSPSGQVRFRLDYIQISVKLRLEPRDFMWV